MNVTAACIALKLNHRTFDERKRAVDTLYETKQLSKKAIADRLKNTTIMDDNKRDLPRKTQNDEAKKKRDDMEVGD